jgi:hypothetical protein
MARQAADSGDHRQAIRCAYWAAIAWLQDNRALPANLTHTPRECVRIVKREPLNSLTTGLERFWYAGQPPGPEDVQESFRQLEALGCKAD